MEPADNQVMDENFLIIKGRFKGYSTSMYGQFVIIFNNSKTFETYNAVISSFSDLYSLEPHAEWISFEQSIAKVKWDGNFNANMTTSLMDHFKKFSQEMNSVSLLYDNANNYEYKALEITLYDLINRIIHDKDLLVETGIQEITPDEYEKARDGDKEPAETKKPEMTESQHYKLEDGSTILAVKSILAPVKGKPIYEQKIGNRVMVNIIPNSDKSNYFIDSLGLRDESGIQPVPAEIIDINAGSGKNDPVEFLTLIAPKLYGKFTEEERQVKLKMYNPDVDGAAISRLWGDGSDDGIGEQVTETESGGGLSKGTLIMLVLFLLILIFFIALIILSW